MIQIYFYKKNFDAQKAERFFKERRVQVQMIDLNRVPMGKRELESVKARVGLDALIDKDSVAWKECPARFTAGEDAIFGALLENPKRLRLPIVRNGKLATVGYQPEEWEKWL